MIFKKIDGISFRKLNRTLKNLALSRMDLEKQMEKELIVVLLEPKKEKELSSLGMKREIEQSVMNLSGFETLRLCLLEDCHPTYREKVTGNGVIRWIEMPVKPSITYGFENQAVEKGQLVEAFN